MATWTEINKTGRDLTRVISTREKQKCGRGLIKNRKYKICIEMTNIKSNKVAFAHYLKSLKLCRDKKCIENCKEMIELIKHDIVISQREIKKYRGI